MNLQLQQHQEELRNVGAQTETVVILGPEDVLPPHLTETFAEIMKTLHQMQREQHETKGLVRELMTEVRTLKEVSHRDWTCQLPTFQSF